MIGIVIVAHGGLAHEYLLALEHVVGKQPGIAAVAINAESDRTTKQAEVGEAIRLVDVNDGVVIVTDMFGGTPSNLAMRACDADDRAVIYGANLPMLVKLVKKRNAELQQAVDMAIKAGHKYLDSVTLNNGRNQQS